MDLIEMLEKGLNDESCNYSEKELIDAVQSAYGYNKKEALEWIKKASDGMKCEVVKGFKSNAKKSFLTDSYYKDNENVLEYLNKIDHKCIDKNLEFHDLRSMFEAVAPKLTAQDKNELKKVLQTTDDATTIAAVLQSKLKDESLDTDNDLDNKQILTEDEHDFISYNDYISNNFTGWEDADEGIDDTIKLLNRFARSLKTKPENMVVEVIDEEESYDVLPRYTCDCDYEEIKGSDARLYDLQNGKVIDEYVDGTYYLWFPSEDAGYEFYKNKETSDKYENKEFRSLNESRLSYLKDAIIDVCDWFDLMEIDFPRREFLADSWTDLRDGIEMGLDSELEVAEGLIDYLKDIVTFNSKLDKKLQDEHPFAIEKELYDRLVRNYNIEVEKYNNIYNESLNEDIDVSDWEELRYTISDGGKQYRLYRKLENGKGRWAAQELNTDGAIGKPFEITYDQARGFDSINNAGKLGRYLGKKLLPGKEYNESIKESLSNFYLIEFIDTETGKIYSEEYNAWDKQEAYKLFRNDFPDEKFIAIYKLTDEGYEKIGWEDQSEYDLFHINEDTVKTSKGKWVNKGKEGTHGTFRTKKEADAQRKAMFANGFQK